ncbi:hypothetical protein HG530_006648 [Fusarium avenaceum]|nr:hypothetical protein HG530_006648 [Fusarium avenaceum]
MAHSFQPSEPSYLLADFPSSSQDRLRAHSKESPRTNELILDDAETPGPKSRGPHNGFRRKFMPGRIFADCIATVLPAALLGFAVAVMLLDGKETKKTEHRKWENAITVSASVFPILFASIVGRMVFEAARWKLEKGARLDLLEQLIGSRTVGATLTTQFNLGKFNILGLLLLILWAFSPLGSQSVLRMLRTQLETMDQASRALYFSTNAQSRFAEPLASSSTSGASQDHISRYINTMYTALLLTSVSGKASPMDLWGNVKIPNLEINDDSWHNVSSSPGPDSYSALIGLPVNNITQGNATFSAESSYVHLECGNLTKDERNNVANFKWSVPVDWDPKPKPNGTWHGHNRTELKTPWAIAIDRFVNPFWTNVTNLSDRYEDFFFMMSMDGRPLLFENETDIDLTPPRLLFDSGWMYSSSSGQVDSQVGMKTKCEVLQRYVESQVHCSRLGMSTPQNCSVIAQRSSRKKHAPEGVTILSWETTWGWVSSLPSVVEGTLEYPDIVMRYLDNPQRNDMYPGAAEEDKYMFKGVTPEQFSRRLAQVINTYVLVSQVYQSAMQADAPFEQNVTVPIHVSNLVEVYAVNWKWLSLFFASCAILLASGIVSTVFAHLAIGPEILGYASSAVRDSKYIDLPPELGTKDALEVTKIIGQRKVKYGFTEEMSQDGQSFVGIGLESKIEGI